MAFRETVILVEPDGRAVRSFVVSQPGVQQVIERLHADPKDPTKFIVRVWTNANGERDDTRQVRIFRERLPEPEPEPRENPLTDELILKQPLPLTDDELKKAH